MSPLATAREMRRSSFSTLSAIADLSTARSTATDSSPHGDVPIVKAAGTKGQRISGNWWHLTRSRSDEMSITPTSSPLACVWAFPLDTAPFRTTTMTSLSDALVAVPQSKLPTTKIHITASLCSPVAARMDRFSALVSSKPASD
eukprot:CAMPEP_0196781058 /NCGR_PEP_ID=MMETSP1104-20130614/9028_1 /TAXON_ID=33652 /ORGANISM="Cafeteria sp., Strain Caron Lab Isolate" /LENGTH=143 /DNA_ID=CAMNT_0042151279 /DNA_START=190 /DNA_END=618 /DNA_ORIENTATION=+